MAYTRRKGLGSQLTYWDSAVAMGAKSETANSSAPLTYFNDFAAIGMQPGDWSSQVLPIDDSNRPPGAPSSQWVKGIPNLAIIAGLSGLGLMLFAGARR